MKTEDFIEIEVKLNHIEKVTHVWKNTGTLRANAILRTVEEIRKILNLQPSNTSHN